jgi:hypothetical protein
MVVIVVPVIMVMVIVVVRATAGLVALTGRLGRHSTTGLTVVTAAILPGAQLGEVV